ncbi:alpha/beta hydrolase [Piscinibacter sakaiensis]|uniref:Carboxylesterase n=1 Tax=Piscinibacter sakaiensis TaxID=1547922 RepID=A0A0K8NZL7_PISS1|nr:hypothetical protein [Piscinibacter sakaiensis]GAP35847.1 carboxylesterase [Piscinibacter sakaiensis]
MPPVPPAGDARAVLVMLHGLGMDPAVLRPFVASLALPAWTLLPTGPARADDGQPAWWPVAADKRAARLAAGPSDLHDRHPAGRPLARQALAERLLAARRDFGALPLVLAGFSQGAMLAVDYTLLADPAAPRPDALVLLSGSCIAVDEWRPALGRLRGLPALVAHGRDDPDLGVFAGERLRDTMRAGGACVDWLPFDGGHQLPLVAWRALRRRVHLAADAAASGARPAGIPADPAAGARLAQAA